MKAIDEMGQTDNTLVIFIIGDNGGSGEGTVQGVFNDMNIVSQSTETLEYLEKNMDDMGGWKSSNLYGVPWAWATNTPFQWTKQVASHFGGTRNGLVISWPNGIKARGEIRSQFHHVIDIVPTILEAAKLPQPTTVSGVTQHPIEGTSMVYTFDNAKAEDRVQDPVLRDLRQLGHLPRRLVRGDHALPSAVERRRHRRRRAHDQVGALQHRQGLLPGR